MSGKGGKSFSQGKGNSIGKGRYVKRRGENGKYNTALESITKPAIRRCARRAGITRMTGTIYVDIREFMKVCSAQTRLKSPLPHSRSHSRSHTRFHIMYWAPPHNTGENQIGFGRRLSVLFGMPSQNDHRTGCTSRIEESRHQPLLQCLRICSWIVERERSF